MGTQLEVVGVRVRVYQWVHQPEWVRHWRSWWVALSWQWVCQYQVMGVPVAARGCASTSVGVPVRWWVYQWVCLYLDLGAG